MKKLLMLLAFLSLPAFGESLLISDYFSIADKLNSKYAPEFNSITVDQTGNPGIQDLRIGDVYKAKWKNQDGDVFTVSFPDTNMDNCFDTTGSSFNDRSKAMTTVHRLISCRRDVLGYETVIYVYVTRVAPDDFKIVSLGVQTNLVNKDNAITALSKVYGPVKKTTVEHGSGPGFNVTYTHYEFVSGNTNVLYTVQDVVATTKLLPLGLRSLSSSDFYIQYIPITKIVGRENKEFNEIVKQATVNKFTNL